MLGDMLARLMQIFSRRPGVEKCLQQRNSEGDPPTSSPSNRPWIGVDLDGTLAKDGPCVDAYHIGQPVEPMMNRVRGWIAQGMHVKIVTARAGIPHGIPPVKVWLKKHGLPDLDVTNEKDFNMIELWDDRAIQVIPNSGTPVLNQSPGSLPKAPLEKEDHP